MAVTVEGCEGRWASLCIRVSRAGAAGALRGSCWRASGHTGGGRGAGGVPAGRPLRNCADAVGGRLMGALALSLPGTCSDSSTASCAHRCLKWFCSVTYDWPKLAVAASWVTWLCHCRAHAVTAPLFSAE